MRKNHHRAKRVATLLATIPLAISQAWAVQVTAVWGSPANGLYATPTNWSIGQVPLNNATTTYLVQIGTNKVVTYDIPGAQTIDGFSLDLGSTFNLQSSSALSLSNLTVLGPALIAGAINANNASFTAQASGTGFLGTTNSVSASNGGVVKIAATSFNASGLANANIITAAGAGSLVDLSSVQSLNVGQGTGYNDYITATGGGKIRLSGVTSLTAPATTTALIFTVSGGSDIDLSSMQSLGGVTADSGSTNFVLDGGTTEIGPLQKANRLNVSLANASTMTMGGWNGSAALTNSTFSVSGGSKLAAASLVGTLIERGLANTTLLSATSTGSLLDLSGLTTLDAGQSTGYNAYITATTSAKLKLSGLSSLVAPASTSALVFTVSSGADLDLSSLRTVSGVTADSGNTNFNVDGATVEIGPLQSANRVTVSLTNGAVMTMGGYSGSASITNSTFAVSGGSTLKASSLVGSLDDSGLYNATLLSAAGNGSLLDLSGLRTLNVGQGTGYNDSIIATTGAKLKLSGVTSLLAPATTAALIFTVTGGADLDLSSLQTLAGVTTDTGNTNFVLDGASTKIGPLQKANRLNVSLANGSVMTLGGYSGNASITNSTFAVASGSKLLAAPLVGTLIERGLYNTTLLSAAGTGSLMDLSGLITLDAGQATGYNSYVTATTGAKIKLAGVTSIVAPATTAALVFTVTGGADIDLSSLQSMTGVTLDTGNTNFNLDGATATLGPLQNANRLNVSLANGSTMSMGGYNGSANITNSTFGVSGGSVLNAAALAGTLRERGLANVTLLSAADTGSVLNLSGIKTLDVGQNTGYADYVTATTGATINLSGVTTLVAPLSNAPVTFTANSGATINLGALQTINTASGGQVNFNVASGGTLLLNGLNAPTGVHFNLSDAGSRLAVSGSLALLSGSTMAAGAGTKTSLTGSFSFQQKVASQVNLDAATMSFIGSGGQSLEVGGKNNGVPTFSSVITGNFAIGELDVGQAGAATVLSLADLIDNGNRATGPEALYLNGGTGNNGLHILGGSILVLNSLNLYTTQNGQWLRVNDLFAPGVTQIAYDQGFIALTTAPVPEPRSWLLMLGGGLALALLRRRRLVAD